MKNQFELVFSAIPENEAFSRMVVSAFLLPFNPSAGLVAEVRTAVSEAVTNSIVHGYKNHREGVIVMRAALQNGQASIEIEDQGCGIEDIDQAMCPFYTSEPDQDRTGIGFSLMRSFMDAVEVRSELGKGTLVAMKKNIPSACSDML